MDVEPSEAIGRLGERMGALEVSLRTEVCEGLAESRAEFPLHTEIREGLAESRRHVDVRFESLRVHRTNGPRAPQRARSRFPTRCSNIARSSTRVSTNRSRMSTRSTSGSCWHLPRRDPASSSGVVSRFL